LSQDSQAKPRRLDLPVTARRALGHKFVCLTLAAPPDWESLPGQFINVLCESDVRALAASEGRPLDDSCDLWPRTTGLEIARRWPVVRRPYSVSRIIRERDRLGIEILVRAVGSGSRFIQSRPLGSSMNVVGPLGNHFTAPEDDRLCILVGGGCGVAPIFGLADYRVDAGKRCLCFFGASDLADMAATFREPPAPTGDRIVPTDLVSEFARIGIRTVVATEDGGAGFHGLVTVALRTYLGDARTGRFGRLRAGEPLALYGCGPTPMLEVLSEMAIERRVPCQLSLERFMGCGIGVCLSCAMKRRDAASEKGWTYRLTCRDGPVVEAGEIVWD
jgi:dihydroorotate dehydrogenase electron transfer subunit